MSKFPILIEKNVFNSYEELIKHLKICLSKDICGNQLLKCETIIFLGGIKAKLVKGQHCCIYELFIQDNFQENLLDAIKLYVYMNDVELLRPMLSLLITITDNSDAMCDKFSNSDLPQILMDLNIKVCHNNFKNNLPKGITVELIVSQIILIIHNIARNDKFQQSFIQQDNFQAFKDSLPPFLRSRDKRMCILTMAVLTWLATDDGRDKFLLDLHSNIVDNFIEYISRGVKDKNRWYEGLHVWELLLVLQALSCTNTVKCSAFLKKKFMSVIIDIFKSKSQDRESEICLGILWNLSFTDNNRDKLKEEFKIEDAIKPLTCSCNVDLRKKAIDFLFYLQSEPCKGSSKKESKYDIFVSYCHAQSAAVKRIVSELKKNFKVWIDTEGIKGSGLSDMAEGIEQSKVLMMAVSNSYKQSQCCHSEATWAYRLKKPIIPLLMERKYKPDGWLGMMISSETYIDVSNMELLGDSLYRIGEHILQKSGGTGTVSITVTVSGEVREGDGEHVVQSKNGGGCNKDPLAIKGNNVETD